MRGKFITVEGTEGVGKSTNIEFICQFFKSRGIELVQTREPGGTPLAEELRNLLLENRDERFNETAELLMVFAARAQHLQEMVLPAIERGAWVLSDRFTDATYAYQGYGRGLSLETIQSLEHIVQKDLRPDKVILLDIDVELGLQRARERAELDRFENEKIEFFQRVRQGYLARVKENPNAYALVDAGQTLVEVQRSIRDILEELVG